MGIALLGLLAMPTPASAVCYSSDVTNAGTPIEDSHNSTNVPANAFDNNAATPWQTGTVSPTVQWVGWIGIDFGSAPRNITQVSVNQNGAGTNLWLTSVLVQASSNGYEWITAATVSLTQDTNAHSYAHSSIGTYRYWRLLADSETNTASNRWALDEVEMMEDCWAPTNTPGPTNTPSNTLTPTVTLTPTSTYTPTPNHTIEITSTAGAPMAFERTATAGDLTLFIGELILAGLIFMMFAFNFWRRK